MASVYAFSLNKSRSSLVVGRMPHALPLRSIDREHCPDRGRNYERSTPALGLVAVGAVSVHGVNGLFYGGGGGQLAAQVIGCAVVVVWAFGLSYIFFRVQKKVQGIRVTRDEEMIGLDIPEMGVPAYPASPHL